MSFNISDVSRGPTQNLAGASPRLNEFLSLLLYTGERQDVDGETQNTGHTRLGGGGGILSPVRRPGCVPYTPAVV